MKQIIVAVDGYSSCGKSTIAKALAKYAGYTYVDTGAMYRATALYAQRAGLAEKLEEVVPILNNILIGFIHTAEGQHVTLNGEDVEAYIRTLESNASCSSKYAASSCSYFAIASNPTSCT